MFAAKRAKSRDDPELFATYAVLIREHGAVVTDYLAGLLGQLETIIAAGIDAGEFSGTDPELLARAAFDATTRFHNPTHSAEWSDPRTAEAFHAVRDIVVAGLRG